MIKQKVYKKRLEILKEDLSIDDKVHDVFNGKPSVILMHLPYELIKSYVDKYNNHPILWRELSYNLTLPLQFIEDNINKPWDWSILSKCNNITLEFIEKYHDKIDWEVLHYNECINDDYIKKYNNKIWDWRLLLLDLEYVETNTYYHRYNKITNIISSHNNKIWDWKSLYLNQNEDFYDELDWSLVSLIKPLSYLDSHKDRLNYTYVSSNIYITPEFIINNLDKNWDWSLLSKNPCIAEFIEETIDKYNWDFNYLKKNINLTPEFIERYKLYDWDTLNSNDKITLDFIENHIDKNWSWFSLSYNPIVTLNFIDKYINKPWSWAFINYNILTLEFIEKYIDKDWDFSKLSYSNIITLDFVLKYQDKQWNWHYLSQKLKFSFKDYLKYKHLNWTEIQEISVQHPLSGWTYGLTNNKHVLNVKTDDEDYIEEAIIYMTKQRIKRITRAATCDPKYKIARKKIKKMFDEV